MNTVPINWIVLAVILVVALVAAAAVIAAHRRRESKRLRERFGPEYDRAVEQFHSPAKAEAELKASDSISFRWRRLRQRGSRRLGTLYRFASSIIPRESSSKLTSWCVN